MPVDGYAGVRGLVYAVAPWDPDGPEGPSPELLVIGGEFTQAGDTLARNIVMWDGERWRTFGAMLEGRVNALAVFRGDLYAAGAFPGSVARWDGTTWEALPDSINGSVECLLATQDGLYVGGAFDTLDFLPARNITFWNGQSWNPPGQGVDFKVWSMAEYGGDVFIGGGFGSTRSASGPGRISRRNADSWVPITPVFSIKQIVSLESFGGFLHAACRNPVNIPGGGMNSVLRWDGQSWTGLPSVAQNISSLRATTQGLLVAGDGARVMLPNGTWSNGVHLWDGNTWTPRAGFQTDSFNDGSYPSCEWRSTLVLSGANIQPPGCTSGIARWNGAAWEYFGDSICNQFHGLYSLGGRLVGALTWSHLYNEQLRSPIYRDGVEWRSIAPETRSEAYAKPVEHQSELYFSAYREIPPIGYNVYAWDGQILRVVVPGYATTLAFFRGELHGAVYNSTGQVIRKWNGTAWMPLPGQVPSTSVTLPEMRVFEDTLVVFAKTSQSITLKRWDGSAWTQMGQPLQPTLNAVLVANDTMYVSTSGGAGVASFSRWNGTAWVPAGYPSGTVMAVVEFQGELIASCRSDDGIFPASWGLYRVTDGVWPLWEGTRPSSVTSMVVRRGELTVTGQPYLEGGVQHTFVARWGDGFPLIQREPTDSAACLGRTTTLEVDVSGTARFGVSYQWSKDGQPLANGLTPHGSRLWGTNDFRLLIGNTTNTDAGTYTCRITTDRGEVQTTPAVITVGWQGCCEPDFNCDGVLDAADLACMETAVGGDESCSCGHDPDFNRDSALNGLDTEALAAVLAGGACP